MAPKSLDHLLADLAREYGEPAPSSPEGHTSGGPASRPSVEPSSLPAVVSEAPEAPLHPALQGLLQAPAEETAPPVRQVVGAGAPELAMLTALRRDEMAAQQKAERERQRREQEEQQRRERIEQQQRAEQERALRAQAEQWLQKLDPYSNEGMWFNQFATRHPNRLAAAIEYLREIRRPA